MALSLGAVRQKKSLLKEDESQPPKESMVMPWQDFPSAVEPDVKTLLDDEPKFGAKTEPKRSQIEAELEPNQSQNGARTEPEQGQNGARTEPEQGQIEAELEPNQSQEASAEPEFGARIGASSEPNRSQIGAKSEPKPGSSPDLTDLSRLQLRCLETVFESCRFTGSRVSEKAFSSVIAEQMKSTTSAVKKAFQRLEAQAFIQREAFKKGPGGWTKYRLPEAVYKELAIREFRAKSEPNRSQIGANLQPQLEPQLEPRPPCSSSSVINTLITPTTTEQDEKDLIPPEYRNIDYSMLADLGCHFGVAHLQQIAELKMVTFGALQYSIYNLEFAISTNWKPPGGLRTTYLTFFMSSMRTRFVFEIREYVQYREKMRLQNQQLLTDLDRKGELPMPNKKKDVLTVDFEALVKDQPKAPFEN